MMCLAPEGLSRNASPEVKEWDANCIDIGLINNMPGSALEATERQFCTLLDAAAQGMVVRLSLFVLPGVPPSNGGLLHNNNYYSNIKSLLNTHLDGIIVTGAEPLTPALRDEPYWESLTTLLEWAEHNTNASIWSCLAAHAAVLQLDGIERRALREKRFGLFECAKVSANPLATILTAGVPERLQVPHSRWNDIPGDSLDACGYHVLTRSEDAGIDAFVKQRKSLFVFFQGHLEYDADSLLLEYRRDVRRFLRGERDSYPSLPQNCIDENSARLLSALRERALSDRDEELLVDLPAALLAARVRNTWRPTAVRVYRNWLRYLSEQKSARKLSHTRRWQLGSTLRPLLKTNGFQMPETGGHNPS
jgi:homoserine O-succinyltransferase